MSVLIIADSTNNVRRKVVSNAKMGMRGSIFLALIATGILLFVWIENVAGLSVADRAKTLPRFTLNLDLPEEQRWVEITKKYAKYSAVVRKEMIAMGTSKFGPTFAKAVYFVEKMAGDIESYVPAPYAKEMVGVANGFNATLADVFLFNVWYSLSAYCTSIVVETTNGTIIHGRNLDYDSTGLLRKLAITVDFQRKGKTVYTGTTFIPGIGLVTGQQPGVFTISLDERDQGAMWMNIIEAILDRKSKFSLFEIRNQLDSAVSFDSVVHQLSNTHFIAPEYFIVGGVLHEEGAVITHGRSKTVDVWFMNETQTKWFIVETNYDHWTTPPPGDDRRDPAIKALSSFGQDRISPDTLFEVLSVKPVLNKGTAYTAIMSAEMPHIYQSYLRDVKESLNP